MYIWLGIDTDEALAVLKPQIVRINRKYGLEPSTLPLHISLKMSFWVEDAVAPRVIESLEQLCATISPFEIPVGKIEFEEVIVWLRMRENSALNRIHDAINARMLKEFGVGLHAYDEDYLFHTTLFMEADSETLQKAYAEIRGVALPTSIRAERILIGTSPTGVRGTWRVRREVRLREDVR